MKKYLCQILFTPITSSCTLGFRVRFVTLCISMGTMDLYIILGGTFLIGAGLGFYSARLVVELVF